MCYTEIKTLQAKDVIKKPGKDMGASLLLALAICLLINFLCPERRAGVKNVRRTRMKISITFYNVERNIDQELRVDPFNTHFWMATVILPGCCQRSVSTRLDTTSNACLLSVNIITVIDRPSTNQSKAFVKTIWI